MRTTTLITDLCGPAAASALSMLAGTALPYMIDRTRIERGGVRTPEA